MVDRLVLELEPRLELLHGDAKAASLLSALSEAKSYASKDQLWSWRGSSARILRFRNCRHSAGIEFGWEDSSRLCWALEAMRELRLLSSCSQVTRVLHNYRKWQDPSG